MRLVSGRGEVRTWSHWAGLRKGMVLGKFGAGSHLPPCQGLIFCHVRKCTTDLGTMACSQPVHGQSSCPGILCCLCSPLS